MHKDTYRLELPGSWVDFEATTDMEASTIALRYLKLQGIRKFSRCCGRVSGLHLFRLPIMWVQRRCEMIDVVLFDFLPELK